MADGVLDEWLGVCINGVKFKCNTASQTLAVLIASFVAFNLKHPSRFIESLLEVCEYKLCMRAKCTKRTSKSIIQML